MKSTVKSILILLILVLGWYYNQNTVNQTETVIPQDFETIDADSTLQQYYEQRTSGKMIRLSAKVIKLLADDLEPPRHQKFIIKMPSDMTVLVTHNIDLADRINSLRVEDTLEIYGQYEWNQRGGVLHWTHHDPKRRRQGGWIKHEGKTYK